MNIKNKLYISAGISIILVVILFSLVLVTSGRIAEASKEHELLNDVRSGVSELDIVTYDYLLHRGERMEQQWHSKYNSLGEILVEAAANCHTADSPGACCYFRGIFIPSGSY